jgi:transcriptional regulator with XRE-family HTH domain
MAILPYKRGIVANTPRSREPTMTPRIRRHRDPERTAFAEVADRRIRDYVQELGGIRRAAQAAGLSPGTLSGWLRPKRPSLPDALSLLRLSNLKGQSLDWLCGRDVAERWQSSRPVGRLAEDFRVEVEAALKARGLAEDYIEDYSPPNMFERAVQLLARDIQDAALRRYAAIDKLARGHEREKAAKRDAAINSNVEQATRGETVEEVLGPGDQETDAAKVRKPTGRKRGSKA